MYVNICTVDFFNTFFTKFKKIPNFVFKFCQITWCFEINTSDID